MDLSNQIELEIYFADHFDTILFPVLAKLYFDNGDLNRTRKVCEIGLKYHKNDAAGLFILANIEKAEGNLKEAEKLYAIVEDIINHKSFTVRSGTLFGYEGLGSIYWHMVSKLLLATLEVTKDAIGNNSDSSKIGRLFDHYYEINAGIGAQFRGFRAEFRRSQQKA